MADTPVFSEQAAQDRLTAISEKIVDLRSQRTTLNAQIAALLNEQATVIRLLNAAHPRRRTRKTKPGQLAMGEE